MLNCLWSFKSFYCGFWVLMPKRFIWSDFNFKIFLFSIRIWVQRINWFNRPTLTNFLKNFHISISMALLFLTLIIIEFDKWKCFWSSSYIKFSKRIDDFIVLLFYSRFCCKNSNHLLIQFILLCIIYLLRLSKLGFFVFLYFNRVYQ